MSAISITSLQRSFEGLTLQTTEFIDRKDEEGHAPLWNACTVKNLPAVKALLEAGANPAEQCGRELWTPIHLAANIECCEFFYWVIHKEDIDVRNRDGATAVHLASYLGKTESVKALIAVDADLDLQDNTTTSALHYAAARGHHEVVKLLIDAGASIMARDGHDMTPLHLACLNNHVEAVKHILAGINDVKTIEKGIERSFLQFLATRGCSKEVWGLLYQKGFAEKIWDHHDSPFYIACEHGHLESVRFFHQSGHDPNGLQQRYTPFQIAVIKGHIQVVELLLGRPISVLPTVPDVPITAASQENISLHKACETGCEEWVRRYILQGASLEAKEAASGYTALHIAAFKGHRAIVALLLTHQANRMARDRWERLPVHHACKPGDLEMVKMLMDGGPELEMSDQASLLKIACENGHAGVIRLLVRKGVDVNQALGSSSPLDLACRRGQSAAVRALIQAGARVATNSDLAYVGDKKIVKLFLTFGPPGTFPDRFLFSACGYGNRQVAGLMLDYGMDPEKRFDFDREYYDASARYFRKEYRRKSRAIHIASHNGHAKVVDLLIKRGVDIRAKTEEGYTPLYLACRNGHKEVAQLLIRAEADPDEKNGFFSRSPLDVAKKCHGQKFVQSLVQPPGIPVVANAVVPTLANVNVPTRYDRLTPLHLAIENGHGTIVKLLCENGATLHQGKDEESPCTSHSIN